MRQRSDKSSFAGQFCSGQKNGFGVYRWADGSEYHGEWAGNHVNGHGAYIGADGAKYNGHGHVQSDCIRNLLHSRTRNQKPSPFPHATTHVSRKCYISVLIDEYYDY
eukprot:5273088-Amphidinium_carterae.1